MRVRQPLLRPAPLPRWATTGSSDVAEAMTDAGGRWLCHECGENVQLAGAHDEPACSQCGGTFMEHFEGPPLQPPPLGEHLAFEVCSCPRATLKPLSPLIHVLPLPGLSGGMAFHRA